MERHTNLRKILPVLLLAIICVVVFFFNLGAVQLWDRDEPRNAGCAAEMLHNNDWVVPVFNGQLRHQKPALLYWLIMSAYSAFGVGEFAARFWSALLGSGTVLLTFGIGTRLFDRETGIWGGIILATTLMFVVASRAATPDSALICFSTLAIFIFIRNIRPDQTAFDSTSTSESKWKSLPAAFFYIALGLAVLAKGPIGFVMPMTIVGLFTLIVRPPDLNLDRSEKAGLLERIVYSVWSRVNPTRIGNALRQMRFSVGVAIVLAIALPWYVWVGIRTDGEFIRLFFLNEHLGRTTTSLESHSGGWWYYPLAILLGFFPWSVFALPVAMEFDRRLAKQISAGAIFLICWICVQVSVFTIVQTKLPSYATPCFPAIALLVASGLVGFFRKKNLVAEFFYRLGLWALLAAGFGVMVGVWLVAEKILGGHREISLVAFPIAMGAVWGLCWLSRSRRTAFFGVAVGSVAFCIMLFGWGAMVVDSIRNSNPVISAIRNADATVVVAAYRCLESSWVFYGNRPITELNIVAEPISDSFVRLTTRSPQPRPTPEDFVQRFAAGLIISTSEHAEELRGRLPPEYTIVATAPYFLRDEQLVLFGNKRHDQTTENARPGHSTQ